MSHAIDGSVPYDLAGRLRSQEETKAWLEERAKVTRRCEFCGWPLADDRSKGCVYGDCAAPDQALERIRKRRELGNLK